MLPSDEAMRVLIAALERRIARWRIPPPLDREDLVQEACVRWLANRRQGDAASRGPALLVLLGTLRNVLRERSRHERAHAEKVARLASGGRAADCTGDRDALGHSDLRAAWLRWLRRHLPDDEAAVAAAVRWDGLSWRDACRAHGQADPKQSGALQRRISRFLSDPEVQKSLLLWLRELEIEPSLPFPSLPRSPQSMNTWPLAGIASFVLLFFSTEIVSPPNTCRAALKMKTWGLDMYCPTVVCSGTPYECNQNQDEEESVNWCACGVGGAVQAHCHATWTDHEDGTLKNYACQNLACRSPAPDCKKNEPPQNVGDVVYACDCKP
jgi:DNA-directed RNA polymerase specialized sigma24 family protein